MVKIIMKTDLPIVTILRDAKLLASLKDGKTNYFYKCHQGFKPWLEKIGDNLYSLDADLVNLRMCTELVKFKVDFYFDADIGAKEKDADEDTADCIYDFFMSTYYDDYEEPK